MTLGQLEDKDGLLNLLLENRNITTDEEKEVFISPLLLKDAAKKFSENIKMQLNSAKKLIEETMRAKQPIVIHGDYDADGICATAILHSVIKKEKKYDQCFPFIPNRFDHGYGLSLVSIGQVVDMLGKDFRGGLLITVDSGITALDEVKYAKSLGFKVIITDHHQKPNKVPRADVVLWTDETVGSGISWLLGIWLGSKDKSLAGLAALAVVTDLQPLLGFNRSLVKRGLEILNDQPPLGIKELMDAAGKKGEIETYDLGWVIGPRLNASGRILDASDSLKLLTEDDPKIVREAAQRLNDINSQRQDMTLEMYEITKEFKTVATPKIIILEGENYHEGIIGLVAAKIVQCYYRPAIVISLSDGRGKGSARSIPGIDIISILRYYDDLFDSLGGHPMAAGFTISRENISVLRSKLEEHFSNFTDDDLFTPVLEIDAHIPINFVDLEFLAQINKLRPFGMGNNEPLFLSEGIGVTGVNIVGKDGKHLSLNLFDGSKYYRAIYFYGAEHDFIPKLGDKVDIVYHVKENQYNGKVYVDFVVRDLRSSEV